MATSDYTAPTTTTPHSQNLSVHYPFTFQSPASRQAKRKNVRRPRRSTLDKPNSRFKQTKQIILTEYNNIPTLSSKPIYDKNEYKSTTTESDSNSNNAMSDIQKVLVRTKLIEFSCENTANKSLILSYLSNGWYLPKKNSNIYKCKINKHLYITCTTLSQCLNYTFQEFMHFEWTQNIYYTLMIKLTLTQKALLFSMGCNKTNNTINGIKAVDWIINNSMAKTREEAIILGQQMVNKKYLCDINNRYDFCDNNYLYYFCVDIINKEIFSNNNRNNDILMNRLYKHNDVMNYLVKMTLIDGFDKNNININEYMNDIKKVFYIPLELDINNINNNNYICKIVDNISFDHWYECIQFILNEFWDEIYSQNIYNNLIKLLSIVEKCKLMSISINTKTKKYRLKKYKNCFNGSNGIDWLINKSHFVYNINNALELCNIFINKGLIKQIDINNNSNNNNNNKYKNDESIFYTFDLNEIDNQMVNNIYNKPLICAFNDNKHGKIIQNLILMSMSSSLEIELLLDLSVAFYLPRKDNNKFISKYDNNLIFLNIIDLLHYILIEKFNTNYSQIIYRKLLQKLSITQSCKLFSIGIECKTRKKHFKKYKNCFIGGEASQFLINKGFCNNYSDLCDIANKWLNNGYITNITNNNNNNNTFKNDNNSFYIFNDIEINKQCIIESYNKNNKQLTTPITPYTHNNNNPNASPYTENIFESEEHNIFFNDIDYNILSDNNSSDKHLTVLSDNEIDNENETFIEFEITRTDPIKITKSKSRNNLSVYSNMAVHNGYKSQYNIDLSSDIVVMDSDDSIMQIDNNKLNTNNLSIDILTSYTNNTPEPYIDFDINVDEINDKQTHNSMDTRITNDISTNNIEIDINDSITELTDSNDTNDNNDDDDNTIHIINNESHQSQKPLLPIHTTNSTETSSLNSQRSNSHSRYNTSDILQFKHHIINSCDSFTFNTNNNDNHSNIAHFTRISDSNITFNIAYPDNNYTPNQIGV